MPLRLKGHVLVLNWSSQSISLLRQLSNAQADPGSRLYQRPVVILADHDKATVDAAISSVFKGTRLRVFFRRGLPTKARDLERVAAADADTVLVLQPGTSSCSTAADALKATALISLICLREQALGSSSQGQQGRAGLVPRCVSAALSSRLVTHLSAVLQSCRRNAWGLGRAGSLTGRLGSSSSGRSRKSSGSRSLHIVVEASSGVPWAGFSGGDGSCGSANSSSCADADLISYLQASTSSCCLGNNIQQVRLMSSSMLDM